MLVYFLYENIYGHKSSSVHLSLWHKVNFGPWLFLFLVRLWHVAGFLTQAPPALRVPTASTFIMKQNNNHLCQICMFYLSVYAWRVFIVLSYPHYLSQRFSVNSKKSSGKRREWRIGSFVVAKLKCRDNCQRFNYRNLSQKAMCSFYAFSRFIL